MSDLERDLRELGAALAFPPTPDLATAVTRDLPAPTAPRWRRLVPVAVSLAVLAIAATMAVPQARTAVLRFFGVGAVEVRFVDRLPTVDESRPVDLGQRIDPGASPLPLLESPLLGDADAVYLDAGVVTQLFGAPDRVRLLVTQIAGSGFTPLVGKKLLATGTAVEFVAVPGSAETGVWIEGEPHVVDFPGGPPRLAGNTLIWLRDGVTVRLEGALVRDQALRIAGSLR